jgi:hypothetical protein
MTPQRLLPALERAEQFSQVTGKIVTTLCRWCRAAEDGLGPLSVPIMPRQSRAVLAQLDPHFATIEA